MDEQDHMASREPSHAGGVKPSREAELKALLARVEAATGPDRELDRAIAEATGWTELRFTTGRNPATGFIAAFADYTASLDAALALVERVYPRAEAAIYTNWPLSRHVEPDERGVRTFGPDAILGCWVRFYDARLALGNASAEGANPALALLAALLKALIAEAASPESGSTGVWPNQSPTPLSKTEVQS